MRIDASRRPPTASSRPYGLPMQRLRSPPSPQTPHADAIMQNTGSGQDDIGAGSKIIQCCTPVGTHALRACVHRRFVPTLRTRLLNNLCNIPSGPNTDRNVSDGNADVLAKDSMGSHDVESGTAAADGDAGGKIDSSKSGKSKDRGKGKNGDGQAGQAGHRLGRLGNTPITNHEAASMGARATARARTRPSTIRT